MASLYPSSNVSDEFDKALNKAACLEIWEKLFDRPSSNQGSRKAVLQEAAEPYFDHLYADEQLRLKLGSSNKTQQARKLALKRHEDVVELAGILEKNKDQHLSEIIADLKSTDRYKFFSDEQIKHSIDLAVRLAFLVNARHDGSQSSDPHAPPLQWNEKQTLREFMGENFPPSAWAPQGKENLARLNPLFTASYMVEVCGLSLEYTASLHDHLRMRHVDKRIVLRVFPYKVCLNALDACSNPVIPKDVLREAIETLNLLFPVYDPATEKLLMNQQQKIPFHAEAPVGGPRGLNIFEYNVWRDRLLELYENVYLSPPASVAQLWKDRRNPQQFWTFWIALLILALTIVSTLATIMQTVYSVLGYYAK